MDVFVPTLTLAEFLTQLQPPLNEKAQIILQNEGFETVAALLGASRTSLKNAGLRAGDIGQLTAALKEGLQQNQVNT
jgi:hypothetical protein